MVNQVAGQHLAGNSEPRLGSPSPSPKGTMNSYPAFPADKHASSTPMR